MEPLNNKIRPTNGKLYLTLIFIPLAWGTTFIFIKEIVQSISPNVLIVYRFGIASLILLAIAKFKNLNVLKNLRPGLLLGPVIWAAFASQFFGLQYTSITNSAFITGTFIVFIPFLAWLINAQPVKLKHILSVIISLMGLWLLTGGVGKINLGDLLTLLTAIAAATHVVLSEKFARQNFNPTVLNFQQLMIACVLSGLLIFFSKHSYIYSLEISTFWKILYLAIIPTVVVYFAQFWVQKFVSAMTVSLFFTLEPVFAVIFAYFYMHEVLNFYQIFGCALTLTAIVLLEIDSKQLKLFKNYGTVSK